MPIQPTGALGVRGTVEIDSDYIEGLEALDGFSHLILIYHFHLSAGYSLMVKPFLDDTPHGLFATRAPKRPNPIGLSVVKLLTMEGAILHVEDVDILDGTPLLDIKPYVPAFDARQNVRIGWLQKKAGLATNKKSDARFKT